MSAVYQLELGLSVSFFGLDFLIDVKLNNFFLVFTFSSCFSVNVCDFFFNLVFFFLSLDLSSDKPNEQTIKIDVYST